MFESVIKTPLSKTAYGYHQAVWSVIRNAPDDQREFLFKVREASSAAYIKIRSHKNHHGAHEISDNLMSGHVYKFSISLTVDPDDVRGGIIGVPSINQWFKAKMEKCGVDIAAMHIDFMPGVPMGKPDAKSKPWNYRHILITGELCVMDAESAREMLLKGVGRGRAFGFGLMELEKLNG